MCYSRLAVRLAVYAVLLLAVVASGTARAASKLPIYLWLEPEWFEGVKGSFAYWTGEAKSTGFWGIAGPGISAEWTQGGESEWNSMGVPAEETRAACQRDLVVPRAGRYRVWVRYVEHRKKNQPFRILIEQPGKVALSTEFGTQPVLPPNDEYQLYWGFSFAWASAEAALQRGPARLVVKIERPGQAWRQVDALLLTDDLAYTPIGREKPPFAYLAEFAMQPRPGTAWRGSAKDLPIGAAWQRRKLARREFTMWTGVDADARWWSQQKLDSLSLYEVLYHFSPPSDIREAFHKQFAGRKDLPILSSPDLVPGFYLATPDLSPGTPLRSWLERTRTPFHILTNYANPQYTEKTGPATYAALIGPLAEEFLGYIHGESIGSPGVAGADKALGKTRREHVDALARLLLKQQSDAWSKVYKTRVPESYWAKGISCLSAESIALAHLFHDMGAQVVGYEEDATNVHVPMRIAFERGAARQYGGAWINYASGNFGDACNYFLQNPVVPRGAPGWFHSKYAITDGVSICWYRKLYYLNYLGGASAIYWEQNLGNQWMLPGPGKHPIQLSPFGRATEDFQAFVSRLPDRGEPYTPIGILLSYGHGYERVNNSCKMLNVFPESTPDRELRELFNVCWHPSGVVEGLPAAPDVQSMPSGVYGNIFDVLVDRPNRSRAIFNYPVIWAAGDVDLSGNWPAVLEEYVRRGGTLVLNIAAARQLPERLLGFQPTGQTSIAEEWTPAGEQPHATTPYEVAGIKLKGAEVRAQANPGQPLLTRHEVGAGAVLVLLVPHLLGQDERAHPAVPYLMNALTQGLIPIEVRQENGKPLTGQVMYQVNKTKDGYLVALVNNRGVDKTQSGVARVDRRTFADVMIRTRLLAKSAREYTGPRTLSLKTDAGITSLSLRVHPGDVQVVYLVTQ